MYTIRKKLVKLVNDVNNNGKADIGDEIKVNGEHFYVIKNDGTTVNALAKYNLNVGPNKVASEPEGKQSALATGWVVGGPEPFPGAVAFSKIGGWLYSDNIDIQVYGGPVITAINTYKNVVTEATNIRLITKTELDGLGCSESDATSGTCLSAPSWIYSTSYWTESAVLNDASRNSVWFVSTSGGLSTYVFDNDYDFGVRPVITIPSSLIGN